MKRRLLLFFWLTTLYINLYGQRFDWVNRVTGEYIEVGRSIHYGSDGFLYVAGYFSGKCYVKDSFLLDGRGDEDIYLAKYTPNGDFVWAVTAGSILKDQAYSVTMGPDGNLYLTGFVSDYALFETTALFSNGQSDIFTASYDTDGNLRWVKLAGGQYLDEGLDIVVSSSGVYVSGYFTGSMVAGSNILTTNGSTDICLLKYDFNGNLLKAESYGGAEEDIALGIACGPDDFVYITGSFKGPAVFDTITAVSNGTSADLFVACFDKNLNVFFCTPAGGNNEDLANDIDIDEKGNSYVTGYFLESTKIGNDILQGRGYNDMFVAKFGSKGLPVWARSAGSNNIDFGNGISTDRYGNSYVCGTFDSTHVGFEDTVYLGTESYDVFIAKYDPNGALKWVKTAGGAGPDIPSDVTQDDNNQLYVTGYYYTYADFDSLSLPISDNADLWIARMSDADIYDAIRAVQIEDIEMLTVYPNPATEFLYFPFLNDDSSIEVIDINGRKNQTLLQAVSSSLQQLDIRTFHPGTYYVLFRNNEGTISRIGKFIKN